MFRLIRNKLFLLRGLSWLLLMLAACDLFGLESKPIVEKRSIDHPSILYIFLKLSIDNAGELVPKPKAELLLAFPNEKCFYFKEREWTIICETHQHVLDLLHEVRRLLNQHLLNDMLRSCLSHCKFPKRIFSLRLHPLNKLSTVNNIPKQLSYPC